MSNPGEEDATPIASVRQLADTLESGGKPPAAYRIGTEHEKFGFAPAAGYLAPAYEPNGIKAMLDGIAARGWEGIFDQGNLIGLKRDGESVSLEPGGQFELSGGPVASLHETKAELERHFEDVHAVAGPLGFAQSWCGSYRPRAMSAMLATNAHAPPELRVNGPLSNMREFQKAFACPDGSKMARKDRCEIW